MPNLLATRVNNAPIAFRPASAIATAPAAPAAAPTTTPAASGDAPIAFRPAAAPVSVDALLDRFESSRATTAPAAPVTTPAAPEKLDRPVLLFNSQCEVCQVLSSWVKAADLKGDDLIDERPLPNDPTALKQIHPDLDIWKAYEEIHVVMPDGRLLKGGEAIAEVLKRLPYTSWMSGLFNLEVFGKKPGVAALHVAYKFLDAIRPALGCSSCGGGPVVWWAKPIKWGADLVKWVMGKGDEKVPAEA
jgi:predicted DCC family thiol-disulfide oxidoreductase YuxK